MYKDVLTVAVVNFHAFRGDVDRNLSRICGYVEAGAKRGADVIVLPETALTGYINDKNPVKEEKLHRRLAQTVPGPATQAVCEITKKYGVYAVFGLPERDGDAVYNSAAACLPDGMARVYRKLHLPADEFEWADRGDKPLLLDTPWGPVGVGICYDVYEFPELLRYYRAKGARLVLNPCAVSTVVGTQHQNNSLRAAVTSSQLYIASADLFGMDGDLRMQGASSILGPGDLRSGVAIYAGDSFGDPTAEQGEMHMATIDLSYTQQTPISDMFEKGGRTGRPDWRPELYKEWLEDIMNDPEWTEKF